MKSSAGLTLWMEETTRLGSPDAFSMYIALAEKKLPFELRTVAAGELGPRLEHGSHRLHDSTAVDEYLAEVFPFPEHPRLFPADLKDRSLCRELRTACRTGKPPPRILDAAELLLGPDRVTLFSAWCIADADLAFLVRSLEDREALVRHARAQWLRPSMQAYLALQSGS